MNDAIEAVKTSSGVQDLITRLRDEGVQAGRQEAEKLLARARQQAADIVDRAQAEADSLLQRAEAEIARDKSAALEALQLAARDTSLDLRSRLISGFERYVKRLVSAATMEEEVVKCLVLVLAGHAADEFIKDKALQIRVSHALFADSQEQDQVDERARQTVLEISSEMLRQGVELVSDRDVKGGARVQVVGENLELDLSDEAISAMILSHLLPRFRAILAGEE